MSDLNLILIGCKSGEFVSWKACDNEELELGDKGIGLYSLDFLLAVGRISSTARTGKLTGSTEATVTLAR